MFTITVRSTERKFHPEGDFIEVVAEILKGKKVLAERRFGYDLLTTKDEILADLSRTLDNFIAELSASTTPSKSKKLDTAAEALCEDINGMTIDHKTTDD